ncbi:DUF4363 family protein [Bacillus sinesaloumensis]|uniref:DUF4363 family protein n=1 Tax=Litchfieldia sinesaloumensis TaxID=1926280 RepID=UPI00098847EB|nr:DUF4363 family protein [Bacillus sinesaloumensis]
MIKKNSICLLLFVLLAGCANTIGGDLFYNHIDQLEEALDQPDWEQIKLQAEELNDIYIDSKWKLQLLGDEGEYEQLNESIQKIIAAVKEEDTTNVRMELATARSLVADIYSL